MHASTMIGPSLDLRHQRSRPPLPLHPIVVRKFGGTLLRSPEGRARVLDQIRRTRAAGHPVVVVASAMGRAGEAYATDTLLQLASDIGPDIDPRTRDPLLKDRQIPVVAGFQGRTPIGDVTTLGRGGSDITAVALAAALGAKVEIFKDVEGVLTADPRVVPSARPIARMSYADAVLAGWQGARVLHPRAAELAQAQNVPLAVRPLAGGAASGTTFVPPGGRCTATILVVQAPDVAPDTPVGVP